MAKSQKPKQLACLKQWERIKSKAGEHLRELFLFQALPEQYRRENIAIVIQHGQVAVALARSSLFQRLQPFPAAMGGRIFKFRASRTGGYVLTDKANFWIALAPYFHPLYSILIIAVYGGLSLFYDLKPYTPLLFALLGLTWAFHFSFTLWMIPKGQTDLSSYGTFFSLVVIYLINLLLVCALLIFAAPEITFAGFAAELVHFGSDLADAALDLFNTAVRYFVSGILKAAA